MRVTRETVYRFMIQQDLIAIAIIKIASLYDYTIKQSGNACTIAIA